MPEEALTSETSFIVSDAYRYFAPCKVIDIVFEVRK